MTRSTDLAVRNAAAIGAGHSFIVFLRDGFPVNVLNAVKHVPEVCRVFCATANPVEVDRRGDGAGPRHPRRGRRDDSPVGVETAEDVAERMSLLRRFGYKL